MIAQFIKDHVFMSSIFLFGACNIFLQWLMTLSLKGYVKASLNMKTTKKKIMINLKNQFETIYGMNYQVRNIDAYVDKYLLKLRFLGISFSAWERMPFIVAGWVTLIAGCGVFYEYLMKAGRLSYVEILFAYGVTLVFLFVFFHIFGIKSRKQQIHIQLVDYLENYLTNRLIRLKEGSAEMKLLDEEAEAVLMESKVSGKRRPATRQQDMDMLKRLIREMDQKVSRQKEGEASPELEKDTYQMEAVEIEEPFDAVPENQVCELESAGTMEGCGEEEKSDIELLEEFVQSFLA